MIQKLIQQANSFINDLYLDVECCEEEDIYKKMWEKNNSILYIVHNIKSNRLNQLDKLYEFCRLQTGFRQTYFNNIIFLIRYNYQPEICKTLVTKILAREDNASDLWNLLPIDLFKELKRYNPVTYERRLKKVMSKDWPQQIDRICDSSRGYSQVTLVIVTFLQNSLIKRSHQEAWGRILGIVGRHDLDFNRVIDVMLSKIVDNLQIANNRQNLAILENINFQTFMALVSKNLCHRNKSYPQGLTQSGCIFSLVSQDPQVLFEQGIYFYHPKYLNLLRILVQRSAYTIQQILPYFYCIQTQKMLDIEIQTMKITKDCVTNVFNFSYQQKNQPPAIRQALHCFRLSLMCECIKNNDFGMFYKLYISLWPQNRFNLIIHPSLIRELCLLIEWIIQPIYNNYCYPSYFNRLPQKQSPEKEGGFFKQYTEANQTFFRDIQLILSYLGINIGFSIKTLVKLLRICKLFLKGNKFKLQWNKFYEIKDIIKEMIQLYLLPGITLHKHNPNITFEVYSLLEQYSQEDRFEIYNRYYNEIMFQNPYLAKILVETTNDQLKITQWFNPQNKTIFSAQICHLTKGQHNQCFQSSMYFLQRILSKPCPEAIYYAKTIGKSTQLSGDVMIFLLLNRLTSSTTQQEQQKFIAKFIYDIFKHCQALSMNFFVKILLKMMYSGKQTDFRHSLNIWKFFLDNIFPNLSQFASLKVLLEYLTYGYHLKLQISDQIKSFDENKYIRGRMHAALSSQLISGNENQHSLLYYYIHFLSNRINDLMNSTSSFLQMDEQIDELMDFLSNLTNFYVYQTNRIRERSNHRLLESNQICLSESQLISMIRDKSRIPLAISCKILRALRKQDLFGSKIFQPIPLRRFWEKIYKDQFVQNTLLPSQIETIDSGKATSFMHSDFYFFFWTSDLQNICHTEQTYKSKIEELRRIVSRDEIFHVSTDELQHENRQRYLLAYNLVEKEKEQLGYYYNKFNITLPVTNSSKPTHERIGKLTIPAIFTKQKDQSAFVQFVSLFFSQCLLPRLVIDDSQAIFCSKIVYKIIKENKLSSKNSLLMIFTLLEAAISYVPYCSRRQIGFLIIFTADFLRLFNEWEKMEEFSVKLQTEIFMEKFNDKRYQKLKDFINHFQTKFIANLTQHNEQAYIIRNCLTFIEKNQYFPLSQGQVGNLIKHLSTIRIDGDNLLLRNHIMIVIKILEKRKKQLGSFPSLNYLKQLKFDHMLPINQPSKPKIYKQEQVKKSKTKEYINIY